MSYRIRLMGGIEQKRFLIPGGVAKVLKDGDVVSEEFQKMYPTFCVKSQAPQIRLDEEPVGDAEVVEEKQLEVEKALELSEILEAVSSKEELVDFIKAYEIDVTLRGNAGLEKQKSVVAKAIA